MEELRALGERFLAAWDSQDVERVIACYTDDLVYRDPNTKGEIRSAEALRHYLRKLFAAWTMRWTVRELFPLAGGDGAALLWRASFQRSAGGETITLDGMDLVLLAGDRVQRNDVYFDRAALAPLLGGVR
jgi:ketosteroid isomerase-like protein